MEELRKQADLPRADVQGALARWLGELAAGQTELRDVLDGTFRQLADLLQEWQTAQATRDAELRSREATLAERQIELQRSLQEQHRREQELAHLREQLEARSAELDRRHQDLERRAAELERSAAETRRQLEATHSLKDLLEQFRTAGPCTAPPSSGESLPAEQAAEYERRIQQLQEQLTEAQRQQEILETEVEVLRHRAMEWLELLADQRRQVLEEKACWAQEIRQFRRLIEVLMDRQLEPLPDIHEDQANATTPRVITYEPAEAKRTGTGDAFLDSLSAQFEQLQREFDRRRKSGP